MKQEPIRVLQIVGRMDRGGIETMIMNLYRHIDRDQVQFDFLAHYGREAVYNDEIRALGGRIYEMPALKDDTNVYYWRLFSYLKALHRFFREHPEYKVIHGHMTNTASLYMPIAKKYGVTCRIAHSHSSKSKEGLLGLLTDILHKPVYRYATDFFTCSDKALHWFFPQWLIDSGRVQKMANAVDARRFSFDPEVRSRMRNELQLGDALAIICVGRFRPEKNQAFLIDVLSAIKKMHPDAVLVFVGDGPCEADVRAKVSAAGLDAHTRFLGMRTDVPDLLQAADVFVLPSVFEGMPVTAIEAQASGLHCVATEGITTDIDFMDAVTYLPLEAGAEAWAKALLNAASHLRTNTYELVKASGNDINTTAPWLQEFYLRKHAEGFEKRKNP